MDKVWAIILNVEFWKIVAPTLIAVTVWWLTERSKARWEQFKLKEGNYKELILSLKGLYDYTRDQKATDDFLRKVDLCWLYSPDSVIQKAYAFIKTVHTDKKTSDEQKELACGELIQAIRKDMLRRKIVRRSKLRPHDFKILVATPPSQKVDIAQKRAELSPNSPPNPLYSLRCYGKLWPQYGGCGKEYITSHPLNSSF